MSPSIVALEPTNTSLPARSERSASGWRTFQAGIERRGSDLANHTRSSPSACTGMVTSPSLIASTTCALAGRVSVGGRRFHDIAGRALGDPQRLQRQARLDLAVEVEHERDAADDPVAVRQPVEKAEAARGVRQSGNRNEHAFELADERVRRIPDEGKARLGRQARLRAVMSRGEEFSEHHRTIGDRVRERHVAVGALLAARDVVGAMDGGALAGRRAVGRPVLFGKQDVEADRGDIRLRQRVDEVRHRLARPRPSADEVDRFVVDVDDPDGLIESVRPRKPALILVEDKIFQVDAERREQRRERQRQSVGAEDHEKIRSPLPRTAPGLFRPELHRIGDRVRT